MSLDLGNYGDALLDKGLPGMEVDINVSSIANYNNGLTDIAVGVAVAVDANGIVSLPIAAKPVAGITVRHVTFNWSSITGDLFFAPHAAIPIMEFGRIWVICKDGCNVGDTVAADVDGSLSVAGAIPVQGAFWDSKAAAGEIAIARLNRGHIVAAAPSSAQSEPPPSSSSGPGSSGSSSGQSGSSSTPTPTT